MRNRYQRPQKCGAIRNSLRVFCQNLRSKFNRIGKKDKKIFISIISSCMISPNFEKIQKYLEKYFDQMIVEDLRLIKKEKHNFRFSYPYILLSCTGIDFLGGLEHGFNNNSSFRFQWFVREWMRKINPLYKEESLAYLIYDTWRSGISHQAGLKKVWLNFIWKKIILDGLSLNQQTVQELE